MDLSSLVSNLFNLGAFDASTHPVSVVEKVVRSVGVYLLLIVCMRIAGKRMLAQLNPFDLVVLLMLSNTVQNAIIGNDTSLLGGAIGAVALLATNAVVVRLLYRGPTHASLGENEKKDDSILIENGKINNAALTSMSINAAELAVKAHERGFNSLAEIDRAVMYPTGTIYFHGRESTHVESRLDEISRTLEELRDELRQKRT